MGIKITELAADASITGVELIPVSDAGSPKSVTVSGIKSFVVDQIEAIAAGTAVTGADGVFVLQSGVMKPVDIDLIAQHAIDTVWGKTADAAPAGTDKIPLKDGGTTENTVTLALVAEYVRATIEGAVLDVSNLDAGAALSGADLLLVTQGTTAKKVTFTTLSTAIYSALSAYVAALGAVTTPGDTDVFYVIQGGTEKKVTLTTLKTVLGSVVAPATTTENSIPQWTSAQKTLKDGLTVQTTLRTSATAADTALATEKAVRTALDARINFTDGGETGTVALRFGATAAEGLETVVVDKTVTLGAVEGVALFTLPIGSILRSIQGNVQVAAVAGGTSTRIGVVGDATIYGTTTVLTQNAKLNVQFDHVLVDAADALTVCPMAESGTDLGDSAFSAGTFRVRLVYDRLTNLINA